LGALEFHDDVRPGSVVWESWNGIFLGWNQVNIGFTPWRERRLAPYN